MKKSARGSIILLIVSLCALFDFGWSYMRGGSIAESAISVVIGLFGTAFYLLMLSPVWRDRTPSPRQGAPSDKRP